MNASPMAFSPDGKLFLGEIVVPNRISLLDLASKRLSELGFSGTNLQVSPDGHWLAYQSSDEKGRDQIWVRPFPDVNSGRWQITTEGGTLPLWNSNGRELFYCMPRTLMAVPIATNPSFKAEAPKSVFEGNYYPLGGGVPYSVTKDGQRFLMIKAAPVTSGGAAPQINVVLNWIEELKQKVPVK
jgi:eukaryotic-like serine/threonine-protein kinase